MSRMERSIGDHKRRRIDTKAGETINSEHLINETFIKFRTEEANVSRNTSAASTFSRVRAEVFRQVWGLSRER